MKADTSLRPEKPPRCLPLGTGEDIPKGASILARMVIVEIGEGDIDAEKLAAAQQEARKGTLAQALAGFISWSASRLETLRSELRKGALSWRTISFSHRRLPDSLGSLFTAFAIFLHYAEDVGAITADERKALEARAATALVDAGHRQGAHQRAADPIERFVVLLMGAFVSGGAHLANADDEAAPPPSPRRWGWREQRGQRDGCEEWQWTAPGQRVGWVRDQDVYLEPTAAFGVAQRLAQIEGESIAIQPVTLWKRMKDRGLLASHQEDRLTIQPRIGGRQPRVIHLRLGLFYPPETGVTGVGGVGEPEGAVDAPSWSPDTRSDTSQDRATGVIFGVNTHAERVSRPSDATDTSDTSSAPEEGPAWEILDL